MGGLAGFTNAFLLLYAFDGGLSLVEELLRASTGSEALLGLRNLVALPVVLASLWGLPCLVLTPRLPARLLLPLFLSALWLNWGAAPLPLWLAPSTLGLVAAALQCGLARLAFAAVRRGNARRGEDSLWWLGDPTTPAFSPGHTLGMTALGLGVGIPVVLVYGLLLFATVVQVGTREFVSFDRQGVLLADRRYERDDRDIRLVGMMHVGEAPAYRSLVESFQTPDTVVLEEGVTDEQALLAESLVYDGVAGVLGLDSQRRLASYLREDDDDPLPPWPVWRHADVDLSTFSPETRDWLDWARSVWASEDWLSALREIMRGSSEDPELLAAIEEDVFTRRNAHLLGEIEAALLEFRRVVVPWGALHLPAIESEIAEDGFTLVDESRRHLVAWSTVWRALSARTPPADPEAP